MKKVKIIALAALFLAVTLVVIALKLFAGNAVKPDTNDTKVFIIKAFRFGYSPSTLSINKGDIVRIEIENTDTTHGITIPVLNLYGETSIEFTADRAGEFDWYCAVVCGEGHKDMKGKLIVK